MVNFTDGTKFGFEYIGLKKKKKEKTTATREKEWNLFILAEQTKEVQSLKGYEKKHGILI